MDLTLEESIPLIFYSFFAVTIATVLILAKSSNARPAVVLNWTHMKKTHSKDSLLTFMDNFSSPATSKQKNRHRSQRVCRIKDELETLNRQSFILLPASFAVQYQPSLSPDLVSRSTSCPSVYLSETNLQESATSFATICTEPGINREDKISQSPGICREFSKVVKEDNQKWDRVQINHLQKENSRSCSLDDHPKKEAKPQHCRCLPRKEPLPSFEHSNHSETCRERSDGQQVCSKDGDFPEESHAEDSEVKTCPSTLSVTSDNADHFHVARPALPTTMAPSGVCVDSFVVVNDCFSPQGKLPLRNMVQCPVPHFGLVPMCNNIERHSRRIKIEHNERDAIQKTFLLLENPYMSKKTSVSQVPKSVLRSGSVHSPEMHSFTTNGNEKRKNTKEKSSVTTPKRGPNRTKPESQAQKIQEATREVVSARLPYCSEMMSPLYDSGLAPIKSKSTATDRTTPPSTSSWNTR